MGSTAARRRARTALAAVGLAIGSGCGAEDVDRGATVPRAVGTTAGPATTPAVAPRPRPRPALRRATCPPGDANCRAHTGRVIALESVDPDGDGDLHLIVSGGSVTLPGVTVFDIAARLRPARDPRVGDLVTGSGPVYRGSYGQAQIQVREFRVARAAGR